MHTTKNDSALSKQKGAVDGTVFTMAPSLSDHDLISVGSDLAASAHASDRKLKRTFDVFSAAAMLAFLAPVLVLTALAVAVTSPGPILFRQKRIGIRGQEFDCYKFRSMRIDAEQSLADLLEKRPDLYREWQTKRKLLVDPRATKIGTFLRHSSIDELPQLFNVLRGDMSLVGPRPIVRDEIPRYGRHITSYLSVKPGLSGLWQVTGRNESSYARRVAADVIYARSQSFLLDIKILIMTVPAVLTGKGSC